MTYRVVSPVQFRDVDEVAQLHSAEFEVPMHEVPALFHSYYATGGEDGRAQHIEQRQLERSVAWHGVREPLHIDDHHETVVDGHHRFMAAKATSRTQVPTVRVRWEH